MSEHRTLRWGSTETLSLSPGVDGGIAVHKIPRQMLQLHWDVPLSWVVVLVMNPQFDSSETNSFTVQWSFTFGVGQATATGFFTYSFAPAAGVYTPVTDQKFVAAEDLQVSVTLLGAPGATKSESFQFAAFGAPNNADVLGELRRWEEQTEAPQPLRDMRMGFPPETPVHYKPR